MRYDIYRYICVCVCVSGAKGLTKWSVQIECLRRENCQYESGDFAAARKKSRSEIQHLFLSMV